MHEGPKVQGRAPEGNLRGASPSGGSGQPARPRLAQLPNELRPQSYAEAARAAPEASSAKGKGGSALDPKANDGEGNSDGYTTVDYKGGKKPRVEQGASDEGTRTEEQRGRGSGAEYFRWEDQEDDEWDYFDEYDHANNNDDETGHGGSGQYGKQEHEGENDEEDPEADLEAAKEQTRLRREVFVASKKSKGRNHSHTKVAYADLLAAEKNERALKGPRTYWQEGRKDERRKNVLRRQLERLEAEYEAEKQRFQQLAYEHEDRQQETRDGIKDVERELEEIH